MRFLARINSTVDMSFKKLVVVLLCTLAPSSPVVADAVAVYGYRVVNVYPHDKDAFTQGLFFRDGELYESTGLRGSSSIRSVTLTTGEVTRQIDLADKYFGEGIVDWDDRLISVTWQSEKGFVFGLHDFEEQESFSFEGEGWGLTRNESNIIMSDGTSTLRILDPETFQETRSIMVSLRGSPVRNLNELEWIDGELFANVWKTNWIVRIDPESGIVTGLVDLTGLLPEADREPGHTDVLNGIAYDAVAKRIFVTGKNWPSLFEIVLVERSAE